MHVVQTGRAQGLLRLCSALTGAAHQHEVLVEVPDDVVAVLAQQIERDVVGPGDMRGLELPGSSDVENRGGTAELRRSLRSLGSMVAVAVMLLRPSGWWWLERRPYTTGGMMTAMLHIPLGVIASGEFLYPHRYLTYP